MQIGTAIPQSLALDEHGLVPLDLLDQMPLLASYVDRDLVYRFVNRAYENWYGVSRADIIGRGIGLLAGPTALAEAMPRIDAVLSGETVRFRTEIGSVTGPRPAEITYSPRIGRDGAIVGFYTFVEDLSDRRAADEAVAAALDGLADGYVAIDGDWRVTAYNAAAEAFYGKPRHEVLGRPIGEVWPGSLEAETAALAREVMKVGTPIRRELRSAGRPDKTFLLDVVPLTLGGVGFVIQDTTERTEMLQRLAAKRELLNAMLEASPDPVFAKKLDGTFLLLNGATAAVLGVADPEQAIGRHNRDFLPPNITDLLEKSDARAFAGETVLIEEVVAAPGAPPRTYLVTKAPLRDSSGAVWGLVGIARDIDARKAEERHREVLIGELNHRMKNMMAVVQAIAAQSLKADLSPDDARRTFEGRLAALARAQDVATSRNWEKVALADLVDRAIAPFRQSGRFACAGPDLHLPARAAISLSLALHELATNAVKYGALSVEAGRVEIGWTLGAGEDGAPGMELVWRETGGPPVAAPGRRGFGSRLIERSLAAELGGRVALDFAPDGLVCTVAARIPD
jgi:PAS domain S-box-containing protein